MKPKLIKTLAKALLARNGLEGWQAKWTGNPFLCGYCEPAKKYIVLSKPVIMANSLRFARGTILHEIAHALTPEHGHDSTWKAKCIELGIKGNIGGGKHIRKPSADQVKQYQVKP